MYNCIHGCYCFSAVVKWKRRSTRGPKTFGPSFLPKPSSASTQNMSTIATLLKTLVRLSTLIRLEGVEITDCNHQPHLSSRPTTRRAHVLDNSLASANEKVSNLNFVSVRQTSSTRQISPKDESRITSSLGLSIWRMALLRGVE
jgi:hypothetical protein